MSAIHATEPAAPEVSVIVIFLDEERFLQQALASVTAQTLRTWELVLVDDGSTDRSPEMARQHAERGNGRVTYLEHPGRETRGMSASRNLGLAHARGELIAFLDADDVLVPNALAEMVAVLRAHPEAGMVYGPLEYWYSWSGAPEDAERNFVYPVELAEERVYEPPSLLAPFLQNTAFAPSGMLTRRALLERVGGFEESFRNLYEDQVIAVKLCLAAPVYVAGRRWYRYRQHPQSCCLTAAREGRLHAAREPFLEWLVGYLEREGYGGSEAWHVARRELQRRPWLPPSRRQRLGEWVVRAPRNVRSRLFPRARLAR